MVLGAYQISSACGERLILEGSARCEGIHSIKKILPDHWCQQLHPHRNSDCYCFTWSACAAWYPHAIGKARNLDILNGYIDAHGCLLEHCFDRLQPGQTSFGISGGSIAARLLYRVLNRTLSEEQTSIIHHPTDQ